MGLDIMANPIQDFLKGILDNKKTESIKTRD
jgi:hypothetical protein